MKYRIPGKNANLYTLSEYMQKKYKINDLSISTSSQIIQESIALSNKKGFKFDKVSGKGVRRGVVIYRFNENILFEIIEKVWIKSGNMSSFFHYFNNGYAKEN